MVVMTGEQLRQKINSIRYDLNQGIIDYKTAQEQAKPFIDEINERAEFIAIKYGKKHYPFSFRYLLR